MIINADKAIEVSRKDSSNELELITLSELGEILKLKRTALYVAKQKGLLPPAIRIGAGGQLRWQRSTIEKWLKELEENYTNHSFEKQRLKKTATKEASKDPKKHRGRPTKTEEVKRRRKGEQQ